jgi:hypothetical protein
MSPNKKISKRAAHKAAVEARKAQPFVKVCKNIGRRNALPFPPDFFAMASEEEREGVLLTRVSKKPPTFRAETTDDKGQLITVAIQKSPRPTRGWNVLLPKGERMYFATRRKALKWVSLLQATVDETETVCGECRAPEDNHKLSCSTRVVPEVQFVSPALHAELTEATAKVNAEAESEARAASVARQDACQEPKDAYRED